MLPPPISNASVERVFSQMNKVKNKLKNRMQHTSLENTLHIRAYMQRHDICCHKFLPTEEMLAIFNQDIYSSSSDDYDNHIDIAIE